MFLGNIGHESRRSIAGSTNTPYQLTDAVLFCFFLQRIKYWKAITNYIEWVIYVSALVFVIPICACKAHYKPEAAAFSLFFAWLNLVLYFRR